MRIPCLDRRRPEKQRRGAATPSTTRGGSRLARAAEWSTTPSWKRRPSTLPCSFVSALPSSWTTGQGRRPKQVLMVSDSDGRFQRGAKVAAVFECSQHHLVVDPRRHGQNTFTSPNQDWKPWHRELLQ